MYVIAIGWLYVTLLMAATETNLTAGVLTFSLYGLAPLALFLWLFGTPQRNRQRSAREADDVTKQQVLLEPDQAGHAPGDAVAPIREKPIRLSHGTEVGAGDTVDPQPLQPLPGQKGEIAQPLAARGGNKRI